MVNGLYTARNGMILLQEKVDNASHNMANATTTGFKQSLMSTLSEVQNRRNDQALLHHDESHWMVENRIDWTQGSLLDTGNNLDLALDGEGFFMVETSEGVRYTRSGSFTRNGVGELTTLQGFKVLDQTGNPITVEGGTVRVGNNGLITVDGQEMGKLGIVNFEDRNELQREGRNLYFLPTESAQTPKPAENATVKQGYLEASNVNVVDSMVELIRFQRNYELDQKAVHASDETLGKAVNEIGKI